MKRHAFLLIALALGAQLYGQPTWTDIMNYNGYATEASGHFWVFNSGQVGSTPTWYTNTTQTSIGSSNSGVMNLPLDGSSNIQTAGGYDNTCTSPPGSWTAYVDPTYGPYRYPQKRMTSNYGPQVGNDYYKGVGFQGTLGRGGSESSAGGLAIEAVYFHEQPCFFGGREYGFEFDPATNVLKAYWSTNANCSTSYCTAVEVYESASLGTGWAGTQYFFEMYPETHNSTCRFVVTIKNGGGTPVYGPTATADVSSNLLTVDSGYCTAILNEHGYVTAGIVYQPTVNYLSAANTKLTLNRVYVGK